MFRMYFIAAFFLLLGLTSCGGVRPIAAIKMTETPETTEQRQFLIGTWQGVSQVVGGGTRTWTNQRNADGTYRVDFTHSGVADAPATQSEIGIWGISGGIYFTATRSFVDSGGTWEAQTDDPRLYDAYKVISLSSNTFEYVSLSTGNRFLMRRASNPGAPN